jgi:hypothetical protein
MILEFLRGKGTDHRGRSLSDVWKMSLDELETQHDYIQWMFPLKEPSRFVASAPVLSAQDCEVVGQDPEIRSNAIRSLRVMLAFYGLEPTRDSEGVRVLPLRQFSERAAIWLSPGNHNLLRITRILRSLRLLGLRVESEALFRCLESIYSRFKDVIGEESFAYWRDGAT